MVRWPTCARKPKNESLSTNHDAPLCAIEQFVLYMYYFFPAWLNPHSWTVQMCSPLCVTRGPARRRTQAQGPAGVTRARLPQDGGQRGLRRPERQENDTNILCSSPRPNTARPCAFPRSGACFQEGQTSCVMKRRLRGRRGGRDRQRHGQRQVNAVQLVFFTALGKENRNIITHSCSLTAPTGTFCRIK